MTRLTETALSEEDTAPVRREAKWLTARGGFSTKPAHEELVKRLEDR